VSTWLVPLLAAALTAGLLNLLDKQIREFIGRRRSSRPEAIETRKIHSAVAAADESIVVVSKARDELAEDNKRLRDQNSTDRQRYEKDLNYLRLRVAELEAERAAMRKELDSMELRLRQALGEIEGLKARYGHPGKDHK
jgi:chromosome segregation ATPase